MNPEIDVIIVTWEGRHLLGSCLDHLQRQTVPHRVIVVDNASTDGTPEFVREHHPEVQLIVLDNNLGFGAGNNRGVAAGDAPYVVLVNNDVDVAPNFLERAVAPLREDLHCGAVATLTTRPGDGVVDQIGIEIDAGLCAYARGTGQMPDRLMLGPLAAPCGGAAAYRRAAYEQAGGFDEMLFAYMEDLDLGLRLLELGWSFAEAPDARGVHLGGATAKNGSPFQRKLASFGRGFILGRYRLVGPNARLHAALVEVAVVLFALVRYRTLVPLTERWRGYRAGRRGTPHTASPAVIDSRVTKRQALGRLAGRD